jgi:hypothetical protein
MTTITSTATTISTHKIITVYSIHGSQFTAKVLAALQYYNIPHYVQVGTRTQMK